jgi:hypothetical protein
MNSFLSCLFSVFFTFTSSYHPVHVSILNVDYETGKSEIDLAFKVFTGDIELAIAHNYNVALNLGQINENPEANAHIYRYFSDAFFVSVNQRYKPKLVFKKREVSEDAVWFYFSVPLKSKLKELQIVNALFMDLYIDQKNMVIVAVNGKESGYEAEFNRREIRMKL